MGSLGSSENGLVVDGIAAADALADYEHPVSVEKVRMLLYHACQHILAAALHGCSSSSSSSSSISM
jgi:hypothetical protein